MVAHCILAVPTSSCIIEVVDIATKIVDEVLAPCGTRLPGRRSENSPLIAVASDDQTAALIILAKEVAIRSTYVL